MNTITKRRCPVCGYQDTPERGYILADPHDINPVCIEARCTCPVCRSQWDEATCFSGRTRNRIVKRGKSE